MTTRPDQPRVVVLGQVCIDENIVGGIAQQPRWGSAVLFARQHLVDVHGITPSVIAPHGSDFAQRELIANPATGGSTLVYENTTVAGSTVRAARSLDNVAPVPLDDRLRAIVRAAALVIVAPLLANYAVADIAGIHAAMRPGATRALLAQGYFRAVEADGSVVVRDFVEAGDILPFFDLVVLSDEDCAGGWDAVRALATDWSIAHPGLQVVVTRNSRGAVLFHDGEVEHFGTSAIPVSRAAHLVGAGDTFATALALAYASSRDIAASIRVANEAARRFLTGEAPAERAAS